MEVTEIKNDSTDLHVKVVIPAEDITIRVDKELVKLSKTAKVDGFRVGKVPVSFLKKKYGLSLRLDTVQNLISNAVDKIIKDRNLQLIMDPEVRDVQNKEDEPLEFVVEYTLLDKVELPDFDKISLERPVLRLTDKDIDDQLQDMAKHISSYNKQSKDEAKEGDQVTIDAIGYKNDKAFPGGTLEGYKLVLGSKRFIPGFEDQLIGKKAGDKVSVNVTFPKWYHEKSLAGKPAVFEVNILDVHTKTDTIIDDEFAKIFQTENLEKLKERIRGNLQNIYEDQVMVIMKMKLFDELEKKIKVQPPKALIEKEANILKEQIAGSDDEDLQNKSEKEKEAYFNKLATRRVKIGLMLAEYVKLNDIRIELQDFHDAILAQAKEFPGREKEIVELYSKNKNAVNSLKGPILESKAVGHILERIKLKDKEYDKNTLDKLIADEEDEHLLDHVHGPDCNH